MHLGIATKRIKESTKDSSSSTLHVIQGMIGAVHDNREKDPGNTIERA
jgi:hypothetical protein